MLKGLFVAVVGGLILWLVQDHFRDVPAATYLISDAIEIPNSKGKIEYAQEVLIANSGRNVVKAISIKIPHHISTYKLTKHSNQIEEKVFTDANSFELIYPELPSGQKIKLLVRYDGSPMTKSWITISHADGYALAQENQSSTINYVWIWLAFFAGVLAQTLGDIRKWARESFHSWTDGDKLFRNDKPWYASATEWSELQFEAISRYINRYSFSAIKESAYYQLLNRQKPTLLSEEKWGVLQKQASDLLMARFSKEVTTYASTEKLIDLFQLKKPESLSVELWTDFENSLVDRIKVKILPVHMKASDYVNVIDVNNSILKRMPASVSNEIRELARKYYSDFLTDTSTLICLTEPTSILKTARLDLLTLDQSASVKKSVYRFARMYAMPSRWDVQRLEDFISKEKPEWMSDDEYDSICKLVDEAKSLSDKHEALNQKELELKSIELESAIIRKRVLGQLDLIDKILSNPGAIDKIEDYDHTFAPGNRKNLELVASLLKQSAK